MMFRFTQHQGASEKGQVKSSLVPQVRLTTYHLSLITEKPEVCCG